MPKIPDDSLLPRPAQKLELPAIAQATRRASERLQELFHLSIEAADAFAFAALDPAAIRKAAENPEHIDVPGGTMLGIRTRVWTRRVMPDPRNPRIGPVRRHPIAVAPGSSEDARFRPVPEPESDPEGRPELHLDISSREHLSWASGIAKKYILKDNDWRLSIRNQGVMTDVWLAALTIAHSDGTSPATVPITVEGSSRGTACHDILGVRSADVPYLRDDRTLRATIKALNEAIDAGSPSIEQQEAARCETMPALLLVGFEPHAYSTANFSTAVRSLVALRHVDYPKPWNEAAKMESIADAVLDGLEAQGLITPHESMWLAGALTPAEAASAGFPTDPAIRAARVLRLLTDRDSLLHLTIRAAITGQTTKERVGNKFKLQVAVALMMRSIVEDRQKATEIYKALLGGFPEALPNASWQATYRSTDELVAAAIAEIGAGTDEGATWELAARAAYPLIASRQLLSDRGTLGWLNKVQPDRRPPGAVIERMRTSVWGIRQLGQALADHAAGLRIRSVDAAGQFISTQDGIHDQEVTDYQLRETFPPPGRPVAPPVPETAHEKFVEALSEFGAAIDAVVLAGQRLTSIEGIDGRALIDCEGVDPTDVDAWLNDLTGLYKLLPVWSSIYSTRQGQPSASSIWRTGDGTGADQFQQAGDDTEDDVELATLGGVDDAIEDGADATVSEPSDAEELAF